MPEPPIVSGAEAVKALQRLGSNSHFDGAPICNRLNAVKTNGVFDVIPSKAGCQPALHHQNENC